VILTLLLRRKPKEAADRPGNYHFFIGSDHSDGSWTAIGGDHGSIGFVPGLIQLDPEEAEAEADTLSHHRCIFPDPACEDQGVQSTQSSGESPDPFLRLVAEQRYSFPSANVLAFACQ
jgi:hypothetical protein